MAGMKSRRKGKVVERALAEFLRDHGFAQAHRGQQYRGGEHSADVVGLPGIHIEAKGLKRFETLHRWMEKCEAESFVEEDPAVFIKANGKRWLVCLDAKDFLDLMKELIELRDRDFLIKPVKPTERDLSCERH